MKLQCAGPLQCLWWSPNDTTASFFRWCQKSGLSWHIIWCIKFSLSLTRDGIPILSIPAHIVLMYLCYACSFIQRSDTKNRPHECHQTYLSCYLTLLHARGNAKTWEYTVVEKNGSKNLGNFLKIRTWGKNLKRSYFSGVQKCLIRVGPKKSPFEGFYPLWTDFSHIRKER